MRYEIIPSGEVVLVSYHADTPPLGLALAFAVRATCQCGNNGVLVGFIKVATEDRAFRPAVKKEENRRAALDEQGGQCSMGAGGEIC